MKRRIGFTLNGEGVHVEVDDQRMLLWVLRTELGLTGTKYGCGEGLCGACTVIVDGEAVRSCQLPVAKVAGKKVTTIEGLATDGVLHPLQAAFAEHDALQCGFCTPGMILNAYSLLRSNPQPSRQEIVDGMEGNLCRCGAHTRIVTRHRERSAQDARRGTVMSSYDDILHHLDLDPPPPVSRRDFLKVLGGGIIITISAGDLLAQEEPVRPRLGRELPTDFNAFLRIGEDGRVDLLHRQDRDGAGA